MTISLDHVKRLAGQLSPLDQVRLIEHLSRQIALALATRDTPAPADGEDAWAKLAQLRQELAALPADRLAHEQLPVLTGAHGRRICRRAGRNSTALMSAADS
jgi:hypothetical protein